MSGKAVEAAPSAGGVVAAGLSGAAAAFGAATLALSCLTGGFAAGGAIVAGLDAVGLTFEGAAARALVTVAEAVADFGPGADFSAVVFLGVTLLGLVLLGLVLLDSDLTAEPLGAADPPGARWVTVPKPDFASSSLVAGAALALGLAAGLPACVPVDRAGACAVLELVAAGAFAFVELRLAGVDAGAAEAMAVDGVATFGGLAAFLAAARGRCGAIDSATGLLAAFFSPLFLALASGGADLVRSRRVFFCTDVSPIPVYRLPDCRIKAFVTSFGDQSMSCFDSCKPMLILWAIPGGASGARLAAFRNVTAVAVASALLGACTPAGDPNHPLRGAATQVGLATTVGEPKDFVKASRGGRELAYIPIGRGGLERPIAVRNAAAVKSLESELDRQRDAVDATARRRLPAGAYGQPFPSVAAPPRPARGAASSSSGQPDSYPVSANRMRQIRDNAQRAKDND